jgi:3-dehydroquinate synthetase
MLCAIRISRELGTLTEPSYQKIKNLISRLYLPAIELDPDSIIKQLTMDKKVKDGKNNFILLNDIGNSYIFNNVTMDMIKDSIIKL